MADEPSDPPVPRRRLIDGNFLLLAALSVAAAAGVYAVRGAERFWEIFWRDLGFTAALLPKVAAGVLIAIMLPKLFSRERIMALVGPESGVAGLAIATLAGAAIPGGPSVTFPLTIGLIAAGADIGAGVAMVSGWVLLGVNRTLIWELSFLPTDLVVLRYALSLAAPILLGVLARRLVGWGRARPEDDKWGDDA